MAKNNFSMAVIGVDPGLSGGIAFTTVDRSIVSVMPIESETVVRDKKPESDPDANKLIKIIKSWSNEHTILFAELEYVHAISKQGVTSIFTFGRGYGIVIGILKSFNIPIKYVRPSVWKNEVLPVGKHEKEDAIEFCMKEYPSVSLLRTPRSKVPSDGLADALCIAEYARRLSLVSKEPDVTAIQVRCK